MELPEGISHFAIRSTLCVRAEKAYSYHLLRDYTLYFNILFYVLGSVVSALWEGIFLYDKSLKDYQELDIRNTKKARFLDTLL